jgi:death-on-curing protein
VIYLDLEDLLLIAGRVVAGEVQVRDVGLLESAVHRPRTTAFGADAYPTLHEKAAALLHSVVSNHALVDGNKRLGLASVIAFLGLNGWRLTLSNDEAYDLVIAVAAGELTEVRAIAQALAAGSEDRTPR